MTTLRTAAQQALEALEYHVAPPSASTWRTTAAITALHAALAQQAEPDLSLCPQCNGPADNGHDRSIPPHPYLCTKCMAELPQPSYNGIPLEQWQNKPVQEPVAWADRIAFESAMNNGKGCDVWPNAGDYVARTGRAVIRLYTAPPQRKPLTEEEIDKIFKHLCNTVGASYKTMTRAVERAHGIKE